MKENGTIFSSNRTIKYKSGEFSSQHKLASLVNELSLKCFNWHVKNDTSGGVYYRRWCTT